MANLWIAMPCSSVRPTTPVPFGDAIPTLRPECVARSMPFPTLPQERDDLFVTLLCERDVAGEAQQ